MRHFDLIVIGTGPGGQRAAIQAAQFRAAWQHARWGAKLLSATRPEAVDITAITDITSAAG
jgi:thioredoxin reductase